MAGSTSDLIDLTDLPQLDKMIRAPKLFDNAAYSDVTIRSGGRDFKCHKLILCENSEYFNKLCGHSSSFSESGQSVIELKDDDPRAIEDLLRYIYTGDLAVKRHGAGQPEWEEYIDFAMVAQKYGFGAAARSAIAEVAGKTIHIDAIKEVIDLMHFLRHAEHIPGANDLFIYLFDSWGKELLAEEEFREVLDGDDDYRWWVIDRLARTATPRLQQKAGKRFQRSGIGAQCA